MNTIIKAENLTIKYENDYAVRNVGFEIEENDYCCIVGSNGSGKSTLLKAVIGLVPVISGNLKFNDINSDDIAFLPQLTSIEKNFPATAEEIVITGTQKKSGRSLFYSREDRNSAHEAMKSLQICDLSKKKFNDLSGGQKQRVLLARALCRHPKLLILDEPCTGLDKSTTDNFYMLLEKLNRESGLSILMVSHDLEQVEKYAKNIIEIDTSLIYYGRADEWQKKRTHNQNLSVRTAH